MLQIGGIKKGFSNFDQRPVVVWEGQLDSKIGSVFRVVLTKKNTLVVEVQSTSKNAMEEHVWAKTTNHETDAALLARVLFDGLKELNNYLSV